MATGAAQVRNAAVSGRGLHSGRRASVEFTPAPGPVVFRTPAGDAALEELEIVRTDQGVRVACARTGLDVDGVEHLLAALGGLSLHRGVALRVNGGEVPLADGSAAVFTQRLLGLAVPASRPTLAVVAAGEVDVGGSRYVFEPEGTAGLEVEVAFDAPAIGVQRANWDGTAGAFVDGIAWARTFGFRRDARALHAAGRALGVDPRSVMVLGDDGHVEAPGAPARPGEFARHKLLDLVGDLYLHGGPPIGRVRAFRPGHGATHRALGLALERGLIARREPDPL